MITTIYLAPAQVSASLDLRVQSALLDCTTVGDTGSRLFITRNWPGLSTGEEQLWQVLAWLNGLADRPAMVDLQAHLDPANLAAAVVALADAGRVA